MMPSNGPAVLPLRPILLPAVAAMLVWLPTPARAQEDHSGLTRESYRRNCLLCHHSAAPEGVSSDILAGLHPVPGLKPGDAMPGIICWRRCEQCKRPDPALARK